MRSGWIAWKTRAPRAARMRTFVSLRCHAPLQAGHDSIPETFVLKREASGILGRPVQPRDDDGERRAMTTQADLPVVPMCRIPTGIALTPKSERSSMPSRTHKRGVSRSSRTLGAGCDGRKVSKRDLRADERCLCGRRSRMVLAPRRWRQVRKDAFRVLRVTVARKPGHRGDYV